MLTMQAYATFSSFVYMLLPLCAAVGAALFVRRTVSRPGLFFIIALFFLFGLHRFVSGAVRNLQMLSIWLKPEWYAGDDIDRSRFLAFELGLLAVSAMLTVLLGVMILKAAMKMQRQA